MIFNLLVVFVLWEFKFSLEVVGVVWIYVGGVYYFVYSQVIIVSMIEDYVDMVGVEMVVIDSDINLCIFKFELCYNVVYYQFK